VRRLRESLAALERGFALGFGFEPQRGERGRLRGERIEQDAQFAGRQRRAGAPQVEQVQAVVALKVGL
jgi:hypothetical protein